MSAVLVVGFFAAGWAIGATQDDPGPGAFRFDFGRQTVTGILELHPYPILHVTEGTEHVAPGRVLMLRAAASAASWTAPSPSPASWSPRRACSSRVAISTCCRSGAVRTALTAAEGDAALPESVPLGRWKLAGEICDGKCLAGAMRPGTGLAHKACANLCLSGGVPPVFVSSQPVEGSEFLLIAGPDGGALPQELYDYVGLYIGVEADIERRGDLLVMAIDPTTIEKL